MFAPLFSPDFYLFIVWWQMISLVDALPVLMDLQLSGDRALKKLAYLHVVQDIRRMNIKNKNDPIMKPLQNILFNLLQVINPVN